MMEQYRQQVRWAVRSQVDKGIRSAVNGVVGWAKEELESRFFASATVLDHEDAFGWLSIWLARQPKLQNARRAQVSIEDADDDDDEAYLTPAERTRRAKVTLAPGEGTHRFRYKGSVVWVTRKQDPAPSYRQRYEVKMVARDARLLKELLAEARDASIVDTPSGVRISVAQGTYWRSSGYQPARKEGSVILPGDQYERLEHDLGQFLRRKKRYQALGIPFRRGYLLFGTPGTGKTSTIMALASKFNLNLHILNLAQPNLDDTKLMELLSQVKEGSAILMEDVDALWSKRRKKEDNDSHVSFSGLLNALDGVAAAQGRIVFMTTNHIEQLDAALIRPGRVDYRVEFAPATFDQAVRLFRRFYEGQDYGHLDGSFADVAADGTTTMCELQEYLLGYFDDAAGAVADVTLRIAEAREMKAREAAARRKNARKRKKQAASADTDESETPDETPEEALSRLISDLFVPESIEF